MIGTRLIPLIEAKEPSVATPDLPDFEREDGTLVPRHTQEWRDQIRSYNRRRQGEGIASTRSIVRALNETLDPRKLRSD